VADNVLATTKRQTVTFVTTQYTNYGLVLFVVLIVVQIVLLCIGSLKIVVSCTVAFLHIIIPLYCMSILSYPWAWELYRKGSLHLPGIYSTSWLLYKI